MALAHLTPLDPRYPSRLRGLVDAPPSITVAGGSIEADRVVAVVGSRDATQGALRFATQLASMLAEAGVVIVSGGALGIDRAAHEGALHANGRTWVVAGTGHERCFPPENARLFASVARGPGAMLWPFGPAYAHRMGFLLRNRYLVAMSDAVVVVQAGFPSGAISAARCAQRLNKPLWVVPGAPWSPRGQGCFHLLQTGARPLLLATDLLRSLTRPLMPPLGGTDALPFGPSLALPVESTDGSQDANSSFAAGRGAEPRPLALPPGLRDLSPYESATLNATSGHPRHGDAIARIAGLTPQATTAALLTLALENVLVEGPPGFFRRRDGYNP